MIRHFDPCAGKYVAKVVKDPHLDLAFGGRADFRGKHKSLYNYLSAPGLSVNVRLEEALYTLRDGQLLVNGTFMTEAHVAALVAGERSCKWAYASYFASELNEYNWGWRMVKTSCGGSEHPLSKHTNRSCGGLNASVDHSTATFQVAPFEGSTHWGTPWTVVVHGDRVHDQVSGPHHRLDLELSLSHSLSHTAPPIVHGLIGQSFADPPGQPRMGMLDTYPDAGTFTTSAQAEGAIEGTADMYEVFSPFDTDFAFSRFAGEAVGAQTAAAAEALCDAELTAEIKAVERRAARMTRRLLGTNLRLKDYQQAKEDEEEARYLRKEANAARIVARATSLEVQSGEDLTAAHRRLAEEPACPPPLSPPPPPPPLLPGESFAAGTEFILRIPGAGRRRRRALSAVGLSTVRSAVIEAMHGVGVSIAEDQALVEDLGDGRFKVTITLDVVTSGGAFLEKLKETFPSAEFDEQPTMITVIVAPPPPPPPPSPPSPPPPSPPPTPPPPSLSPSPPPPSLPSPPSPPPPSPPLDCPCLTAYHPSAGGGWALVNGEVQVVAADGVSAAYPDTYGLHACGRHDSGLEPSCNSAGYPAWCEHEWCYIDPAACNTEYSFTAYVVGATLHYSYRACGFSNEFKSWFYQPPPPSRPPPSSVMV